MTKKPEVEGYPDSGFVYRPLGLERSGGFAELFAVVRAAVMIPELPTEKRVSRLEQVRHWFEVALSDKWQPIGQRLLPDEDYDIVGLSEKKGGCQLRHIGSGIVVSAPSITEAEQTLSKEVNRRVMGWRQDIRRDPMGILNQVVRHVKDTIYLK